MDAELPYPESGQGSLPGGQPHREGERFDRSTWFTEQGWRDPFPEAALRAESDDLLLGSFHKLPYYPAIKGSNLSPGPPFIFMPRGGGKSALRRHIERELEQAAARDANREIVIVYNDFDPVLAKAEYKSSQIRPRHHIEQIVALIMQRLSKILITEPKPARWDLDDDVTKDAKELFRWYINAFDSFLYSWDIERALLRTGWLKELFRDRDKIVRGVAKIVGSLVEATAPAAVGKAISTAAETTSETITATAPVGTTSARIPLQDLLEGVVSIARTLFGISRIIVLIDDVDEPQYFGEIYEWVQPFELIRPLASAPKLLGVAGLTFKFFLPEEIHDRAYRSLRLDQYSELSIQWGQNDLREMLAARARQCFGHKGQMSLLCEPGCDLDSWLVGTAYEIGRQYHFGSPRVMILLGNMLLNDFFRDGTQALSRRIPASLLEIVQGRVDMLYQKQQKPTLPSP